MKFNIGQKVWANQHTATIAMHENGKYLVHYTDGKGSDWMDESCLRICED